MRKSAFASTKILISSASCILAVAAMVWQFVRLERPGRRNLGAAEVNTRTRDENRATNRGPVESPASKDGDPRKSIENSRQAREASLQKRVDDYFASSDPQERMKILDRQIDDVVKNREKSGPDREETT